MKFDNPRKQTPEGLKKSLLLNYPGCSNVLEALEKAKGNTLSGVPSKQESKPPSDYEVLRKAILDISRHLGDYNIDFMDRNKRIELYKIPLDSIDNVKKWRDGWLKMSPVE